MKVLLIHNKYQYYGGEDTYVYSLQKLLISNGYKVILYIKDSKNIQTTWDKIKVAFGLLWNHRAYQELEEIIQKEKPDVAHFNNIYPLIGATAFYICKKYNLKIVHTIHNYRFMCPKGILFRDGKICELCINKRFFSPAIRHGCYHGSKVASFFYSLAFYLHKTVGAFSYINTYIFPSKFTQKYYEKYFGVTKNRSTYLPYFVDFKPSKRKYTREDWYLYVGRLSEEKGIVGLLDIFKKMQKYKLKVIGGGSLRDEINQYNKYKNIEILGEIPRHKLGNMFQKAKALIIPSLWYEVSPMVAIEAAHYKTTIIKSFYSKPISKLRTIARRFTSPYFHLSKLISIYTNQINKKIINFNR